MKATIVSLCVLGCIAPAVLGQEQSSVFETAFLLESRLFDRASDRYLQAREQERDAWSELLQATGELDTSLADPAVSVEELRSMESDLVRLREMAYAYSREVAELRRQLYWSLDRLGELGLTIERERNRSLVVTEQLEGLWRIETGDAGEFGIMELELDGTVVSGTYRLSNGRRGSLTGTFANNVVSVERIDAQQGKDASLEGTLDPETGEISGTWTRKELAGGQPATGAWSARKLSPEEQRDLTLEP